MLKSYSALTVILDIEHEYPSCVTDNPMTIHEQFGFNNVCSFYEKAFTFVLIFQYGPMLKTKTCGLATAILDIEST